MKNNILRLTDNLYVDNKDAALLAEANLTIGKDEDGETVFICYIDELSEDGKNYVDVTTFRQVHSNKYGTAFISDKIIDEDFEMVSEILNMESAGELEHNAMQIINMYDEIVNMAYALREAYENMVCHIDEHAPQNIQQTVQNLYRYVVQTESVLEDVKVAKKEQDDKRLVTGLYGIYTSTIEANELLRSFEKELKTFYRSKQPQNYGKYQ